MYQAAPDSGQWEWDSHASRLGSDFMAESVPFDCDTTIMRASLFDHVRGWRGFAAYINVDWQSG